MVVLHECDCFGHWPVHVATEPVGPGGIVPVAFFLVSACGAVVVGVDGVKAMRVAVCAHIPKFCVLGASRSIASFNPRRVWIHVLITAFCAGAQFCYGLGESLDLSSHGFELAVGAVTLCCSCYSCNVFANLVPRVGEIACGLVSVAAGYVPAGVL
jgi:hypothetical protein